MHAISVTCVLSSLGVGASCCFVVLLFCCGLIVVVFMPSCSVVVGSLCVVVVGLWFVGSALCFVAVGQACAMYYCCGLADALLLRTCLAATRAALPPGHLFASLTTDENSVRGFNLQNTMMVLPNNPRSVDPAGARHAMICF